MEQLHSREDALAKLGGSTTSSASGAAAGPGSFASWKQARSGPGGKKSGSSDLDASAREKENERISLDSATRDELASKPPSSTTAFPPIPSSKDEREHERDEIMDNASGVATTSSRERTSASTSFAAFRKARENQAAGGSPASLHRPSNSRALDSVPSLTPTPITKRTGLGSPQSLQHHDDSSELESKLTDAQEPQRPPSPSRMTSIASNSSASATTPFPSLSRTGSRFSNSGLGSPSPLIGRARMNSRASLHDGNDSIAMSPSQNRLANGASPLARPSSPERQPLTPVGGSIDRPSSPTKGLGGFVQSAMLRRSDSVSKRWSAMNLNNPAGLGRRDSVSNVSAAGDRPDSSYNDLATPVLTPGPVLGATATDEEPVSGATPTRASTLSGSRPKSLVIKRSDSVSSSQSALAMGSDGTPLSPNKRWSPSKASWLESALNRPESPTKKHAPPAFGQEPEWKSQLAKMKASRQAAQREAQEKEKESGKGPGIEDPFKKESIPVLRKPDVGGRSFAGRMGLKPLAKEEDLTEKDEKKNTEAEEKRKSDPPAKPEKSATLRRSLEKKDLDSLNTTTPAAPADETEPAEKDKEPEKEPETKPAPPPSKPTISTTSNSVLSRINSLNSNPRTPSPNKLRETPSQFDFRSNLRRRDGNTTDLERQPSNATLSAANKSPAEGQASEFQNVFAKLKRTNTGAGQGTSPISKSPSVKSPSAFKDDFKDNITRGKSALNQTGGPKKTERVDEFKESLNKQRESFQVKDETGHPVGLRGRTGSILEKKADVVPEALERRRALKSSVDLRSAARDKEKVNEPPLPTKPLPFARTLSQKNAAEKKDEPAAVEEKETEPLPEQKSPGLPSSPLDNAASSNDLNTTQPSPPIQPQPNRPLAAGIANRLNPNLAGLLSRGPPSPSNNEGSSRASPAVSGTASPAPRPLAGSASRSTSSEQPGQGPALTHMTKARARGPKRRAPKAAASSSAAAAKSTPSSVGVSRKLPVPPEQKAAPEPTEEKSEEPLQARISRLRSGIAAGNVPEATKKLVTAKQEAAKAAAPPPVAKKSDDVRRISENLSNRNSVEVLKEGSDGEKTPPPVPLHKKPSLEAKEKAALPKRSSQEALKKDLESPKPSPTLPRKPSFENRPSPTLTKKASFETRKPSPGLSPKPDLPTRTQGPVSPSISDRLNQFQGTSAPFKGLRKSPTWGGKPGNEPKPPTPAKDDDMDKPKKSPPPLRSPSSTIQLGGNKDLPPLTKARTWGTKPELPASSAQNFTTPELPLRRQRDDRVNDSDDVAPPPVEKDDVMKKERRPTLPRKSSSAGTFDSPVQNPTHSSAHAPMPSYSSSSVASSSTRTSSSFASIASTSSSAATTTPASHRNTLTRMLPISTTQMTQQNKSPVPEANASSDTASITSTSTGTVDVDPRKPPRRRPTPLKLKSLPSIPVQPVVPPTSKPLPSPQTSPFPERQVANTLFTSFFDAPPKAVEKIPVDPVPFFEPVEAQARVKTLSTQLWELQGHGKKRSLPMNEEHILFEESMYLLVHIFEDPNGAKVVQTILWVGDEVNESSFEDAQLFARKIAKDHNSRLEIMHEGKETGLFIQALGGIIVIRRGSSSRVNSSSYMLCGRRHLGQIVFDEVDLSAKALCSGYPYIISASSGKAYLWQGQGSGADELGCAKLIAMDLAVSGEISQVMEGEETTEFWSLFPDSSEVQGEKAPSYWKSKSTNEKYTTRLFRVDHDRGRRSGFWGRRGDQSPVRRPNAVVQEIKNYVQRDLDATHIHIVDAFFEIYV